MPWFEAVFASPPPTPEQEAQVTPPANDELATRQVFSPPTPFATHVVPEATIKFPVDVPRLAISFNLAGILKVQVPVELVMVNEFWLALEVEKVAARYMVRSAERLPPPARPVPVLTALVLDTASMPKVRVRSAERSPPPKRGAVVFTALVDETAEMPRVKRPVWLLKKTGAVAEREVVVILAEKVAKSADERKPAWVADEVACVQVTVEPEPEREMPDDPEVAKVKAGPFKVVPWAEMVVVTPCLFEKVSQSAAERKPA